MRSWLSVLIADAMSKKRDDIPIAPSLYSLSNKMDNSLLAVRDINHKYIVVDGSTRIYNTRHPQGVTLSDNIITDMGVNIGDYAPGANAWIYFDAATSKMTSSRNVIYRNIIQACGGYGGKEEAVDVIVNA